MPVFTAEERVGQTIADKYRLDRILGDGGMGVVYEARHTALGRAVAVKFLHAPFASRDDVVQRFVNEARAASSLAHPNVVDVLDVGTTEDGAPYIVMERLEGESLAARLARLGRLPLAETWAVLRPAMEAIAFAHTRAIVHRDLKPDNVFLHRNAKDEAVTKVLDFGVAKLGESVGGAATATGALLGTALYMSPEQSRGRGVGPWSDVWAMGVVWYETLTARFPFDFDHGSPTTDVLVRLSVDRPAPVRTHAPALSPTVAAVIDRALTPDVAARYASMGEMLRAMDAAFADTGAAADERGTANDTLVSASAHPPRRGARPLVAASVALLVLVAGAGLAATGGSTAPPVPIVPREALPSGASAPVGGAAPVETPAPVPLALGVDAPEPERATRAPSPSTRRSVPGAAPDAEQPEEPERAAAAAPLAPAGSGSRAQPSREEVLAAINQVAPTLRACAEYQHGIARVRIRVAGATGHVTRVTVTGALMGTVAGGCVARGLRGVSVAPFSDPELVFSYAVSL